MVFDYYPGCTLKTKAADLDKNARKAAEELGVKMEEIENWQCCGAVYPSGKDETVTRLSSVRVLSKAYENKRDLLTLCSACHHVIKRVNHDMKNDVEICKRANLYMENKVLYQGQTKVIHYLEMLRDTVGFDNIAQKVKNAFKETRIGAYYGCLLLRPADIMQFDDPENPVIMEDFIRCIGGTPVIYPYRNECCGGYICIENKEAAKRKCEKIINSAKENNVQILITACPLCKYNLTENSQAREKGIKVLYFTELLSQALGISGGEK